MMEKKKLSVLVAAAVVAAGTAIGITGLAGSTAHAQPSSSITITGMAQTGTVGSPEAEVLVSITCPAGDFAEVDASATQGGFFAGHSNPFTCTGNPQNETIGVLAVANTGESVFAGPASAGATLTIGGQTSLNVGTTASVTFP